MEASNDLTRENLGRMYSFNLKNEHEDHSAEANKKRMISPTKI